LPDRLQGGEPTLAFHRIMEQRGNRLLFVASI
jgi:hypothetical protein